MTKPVLAESSVQTMPMELIKTDSKATSGPGMRVALSTGGFDKPYAYGIAMELATQGIRLDVLGSDAVDSPEMHTTPGLRFVNLQRNWSSANLLVKVTKLLVLYFRLIIYGITAETRIIHILWNNKLQLFDRTVLMCLYKIAGKKVVFTAHNVNAGKRDRNDSWLNRWSLRMQYRLADHIFVHTERMKQEMQHDFDIKDKAITVIPFGINNAVPHTSLTPQAARERLAIDAKERTILFFGAIRPYKGLEYLVDAFLKLARKQENYRLVIAGEPRKGHEEYWNDIRSKIDNDANRQRVLQKIEYIPDEDTEIYFKAADLAVLPYTHVFQSGVLFLAHSFGLPVVATDVGSLREDIIEGKTGYLCKACESDDLARAITTYFNSDLFRTLDQGREEIREYATLQHSWTIVGERTCNVYTGLLKGTAS